MRDALPRVGSAQTNELEKHVLAVRTQGGFADALYEEMIFDFKHRLDESSRARGLDELRRYLSNQTHPERFFGILTDGETLEVYALREGNLCEVQRLILAPETAAPARLWLDCYLFHERQLEPPATDIVLRFGERSPTFWQSLRSLRKQWEKLRTEASVATKFVEWQSLLSVVYGSPVGDEDLFLRHTYLALFVRVLTFVTLQEQCPRTSELRGIVTGETFESMGFENFIGNDFFSWVVQPPYSSDDSICRFPFCHVSFG